MGKMGRVADGRDVAGGRDGEGGRWERLGGWQMGEMGRVADGRDVAGGRDGEGGRCMGEIIERCLVQRLVVRLYRECLSPLSGCGWTQRLACMRGVTT